MSTIAPQPVPGRLRLLAEGVVGPPRVSGDGRVIVWHERRDGYDQIMRHADGETVALTDGKLPAVSPDLSGDGSVIVWDQLNAATLDEPGANFDVHQYRDGKISAVAEGPSNQSNATVSRDGSTVAWDDDGDGRMLHFDIVRSRDGKTETITNGGYHIVPLLSGDGKSIFWRDAGSPSQDIWVADEAGTAKPLVATESNQFSPDVSPDGKTLVWTDDASGEQDLLMMRDGKITTVTAEPGVEETWASMSADGNQVVWTDFDFREGDTAKVHVMLKDGETVARVDREEQGLNGFPSISDDGRTIAWMWQDSEDMMNRRIYVLEREGAKG